VVETRFERAVQLEAGYVSEGKEKRRFLKARLHVEEWTRAQQAYRKLRGKHVSGKPRTATRDLRRDSRKAFDRSRQSLAEASRQVIPRGVISAVERMIELLELPPGWNSYNARPITKENVNFAFNLLGRIMRHDTPAPNVVPMVRGGVQLEWHTRGINLEISIYSPGEVSFFAEDVRGGNPTEGELDLAALTQWVDRLSM